MECFDEKPDPFLEKYKNSAFPRRNSDVDIDRLLPSCFLNREQKETRLFIKKIPVNSKHVNKIFVALIPL